MQLSSKKVNRVFSEIDVVEKKATTMVRFMVMSNLGSNMAEGWKTGVAVDASASMIESFGKGMEGKLPAHIKSEYQQKGSLIERKYDGCKMLYFEKAGYEAAIRDGHLKPTANIMDPEIKKFVSHLADNLDQEGSCELVYWAMGETGGEIEKVGEFTSAKCNNTLFEGPHTSKFGQGTRLLPALEYFEKKFRQARRTFIIFQTDGFIDDLDRVIDFTKKLAKSIEANKRNMLKAVIIGVGASIDESQMVQLDDLDTGTSVDIWDHKIASEMKDIQEIFAELVSENTIVATFATLSDSQGNVLHQFNDGLPARFEFEMGKTNDYFVLEVDGQKIQQHIR